MATPGADDTVHEVTVQMRQQGQLVLNVWQFRLETAVDDLELRLLRALLECYLLQWLPHAGSKVTIEAVRGMQVGPTVGPIYEIIPGEDDTVQGAAVGDTLPTHDSVCISIHTTRAGRHGRGRKFMAGVPENATDGSDVLVASDYWEAILAFIACVMAKFVHASDLTGPNTISVGVIAKSLQVRPVGESPKAPYTVDLFSRATRLTAKPLVGTTNSRKKGRGA